MSEPAAKLPIKIEGSVKPLERAGAWPPFESLRREMDRLFDDFEGGWLSSPFRRSLFGADPTWLQEMSLKTVPAVNVSESDKAFEITAELPGMDEKNIEVSLANGNLTIKGEKHEEKEEKKKDYYVQERKFGSFERSFRVPDSVDTKKIEADFKNGVLKVTLPKTAEAQQPEQKIAIKAA